MSHEFIKSNLKYEKRRRIQRAVLFGIVILTLFISQIVYFRTQEAALVAEAAEAPTNVVEILALSLVANSWTLLSGEDIPNHITEARLLAVEGARAIAF